MVDVTVEELRDRFIVREGSLYKKEHRVGSTDTDKRSGYQQRRVRINGKSYKESRVIYKMFYGEMPTLVDHIDGDSLNNDPLNLRPATHKQNSLNSKERSNRVIGPYPNVSKKGNGWQVKVGGKYLGYYSCQHEAGMVAFMEKEKQHGEFLCQR